jgi:hypothetical protein
MAVNGGAYRAAAAHGKTVAAGVHDRRGVRVGVDRWNAVFAPTTLGRRSRCTAVLACPDNAITLRE